MANAETSAVPAIMAGIEELFVSGDLSDLVIKCEGDTHHVHKLVLCTQSKFFMAACTNGFKESTTGVIELSDDEPEIVRAALRFLYGLDYMENTSGIPELILHTKLYIFADKYNIRALKTLAGEKYNAAAKTGWSTEHFANSIKLIDAFTLPCDGAMRDAVIKHSADHADLVFQNARFVEMMGEVVDFSRGLAIELGKRLAQAKPTGLRYRCPICSGRFIICRNGEAVFGPRAVRNCPFCDRSTNNWSKFVCTD